MRRSFLAFALLGLSSLGCSSPPRLQGDAVTPAGLPNLPILTGPPSANIDRINDAAPSPAPVLVTAAEPVTIFGWALDVPAKELAREVYVEIGGHGYRAQYFQPRPDVGKLFGAKEQLQYAGFSVTIAGSALTPGPQTASVHLVSHDGRGQYVTAPIPLTVQ